MLYLPSEPAFVPVTDLLILDYDSLIGFQSMNQLVGHVLFSVQEFLVLPLDKLDCFIAVIRSLNLSRHLFLESL